MTAVPAPVSAGGGGALNASNVVYSPHATIYRKTYTGSTPPAQVGPFSPLAVTPDGSTVYFFDYSFGAVQFANGAFKLHLPQQNVQSGGTSWFVGGPLAVDALGNVYESAYCMPGQNPCAFGYATSPFTSSARIVQTGSTSGNQAFNDLENTTNGTLLGAGPDL